MDAADLLLDLEDMLMDVLWCEFQMVTEEFFNNLVEIVVLQRKKR